MRLLAALLAATCLAPSLARAGALIPRAVLFGNASRTSATLSPDGKWLAYLAPRDGVMNVWVAPLNALSRAKPVTAEKTRPLREFYFSPDSSRILYLQDKGGTEDFLLYGVNLKDGTETAYTPFKKTRVEIVATSPLVKDAILIGLNNRDPEWHDLYRLDLNTAKLTLLHKGDGYAGFVADFGLTPRLAQKANPDGSYTVETLLPDGTSKKLFDIPFADGLTTSVAGIPKDAGFTYVIDSRGRNTAALETLDLTTGRESLAAQDARADVGAVLADPETGTAHAYAVEYLQNNWVALDDRYRADIDFLNKQARGQWSVTSQSDDDTLWTVLVDRATEPASFWLYDRAHKKFSKLFTTRPELEKYKLRPMQSLEITSRDGRTLTAYLTKPAASDGGRQVPLVLDVHGGPWARDSYGYNPTHQWLANRGYAVLSVNYRGSTGFGKDFITAGDKQWGRAMEDDLLDGVQWAVAHNVSPADQVAITGGSYGGYATLAGVTMHPQTFACGVDIVGPSNLFTLLQTIPPYWKSGFEQMVQRMGDPRTEDGKKLLHERSPLTYADQIARPLLIGQGANDPRVNKRESDQIVAAMTAKKIPVTYVLYPDEGHGFARPENRISFNAVEEGFLGTCLHGAVQPIDGDFKGSSIQVLQGVDVLPGLAAALRAKVGAVAAPHQPPG
jgi:dipeptidyl aminopeptidase/acylaminoacyl peptidase